MIFEQGTDLMKARLLIQERLNAISRDCRAGRTRPS